VTTSAELRREADAARRIVLEAALAAGTCHIGSSLSIVDILTVLYQRALRADAGDRFLLSKGHAASALYAVLARAGILDEAEVIAGYCRDGGTYAGHPERHVPGVELTAGSLGHGVAVALGRALADRADGSDSRTFCLVGDGELDEGSVWEAVALAGHLAPPGLRLIVDANGFQGLGRVGAVLSLEPLGEKFRAFGWVTSEVDGHNHAALACALAAPARRPVAIVARTVKGYGVPALEGEFMSHYRSFRPHERDVLFAGLEAIEEAA
jgi:transketolase